MNVAEQVGQGEGIKKIIKSLSETKLVIGRIPSATKKDFQALAKNEFADDYGMCLKALFDYYIDSLRYDDLIMRVARLEENAFGKKDEDKKVIKTLSGKEINRI